MVSNLKPRKIVKCWDSEKSKVRIEDSMSVRFGSFGFHTRPKLEAIVNVLVFVVVPNFDPDSSSEDKEELLRLIREFRDCDLPTLRLKAACLRLYPDFWDQVFNWIENSLASGTEKTVTDSLGAVLTMVRDYSDDERSSPALQDLVDLLGHMVFLRRNTALPVTIKVVREIVKVRPSLISGRFERSILTGLGNIEDDTAMNSKSRDFFKALFIRESAAGLAYELFRFYSNRQKTIPDTIKKWQDICRSDAEFAEIRNQWIADDQETPEHLDKKQ